MTSIGKTSPSTPSGRSFTVCAVIRSRATSPCSPLAPRGSVGCSPARPPSPVSRVATRAAGVSGSARRDGRPLSAHTSDGCHPAETAKPSVRPQGSDIRCVLATTTRSSGAVEPSTVPPNGASSRFEIAQNLPQDPRVTGKDFGRYTLFPIKNVHHSRTPSWGWRARDPRHGGRFVAASAIDRCSAGDAVALLGRHDRLR